MSNDTIQTQPEQLTAVLEKLPQTDDSRLFGVSVRGWLAVLITVTICVMSVSRIDVKEPLYTLAGMALGFYLGQNKPAQK